MKPLRTTKAFTLLEMLLVIAIIAILAGIVIVAINPGRQLAQARNVQRQNDLRVIHSAVNQYYIDNFGWPGTLGETFELSEICDEEGKDSQGDNNCINLRDTLVPTYISYIPRDPHAPANGTGYKIALNYNQTVALSAPRSASDFNLSAIEIGTSTLTIGGGGSGGDDNGNDNGNDSGGGDDNGNGDDGGNGSTPDFQCGNPLIDTRDGQTYATVQIGTQCWMQENLNVGTMITGSLNQGVSVVNIEKYCYDNLESNCNIHGGLYQWNQAMGGSTAPGTQGICPDGWHIPTHSEFTALERTICNSLGNPNCNTAFPDDTSTWGWRGTNEGIYMRNMSGDWKAFLTGRRGTDGLFNSPSHRTSFWFSVEGASNVAWHRTLNIDFGGVFRNAGYKTNGYSVRCLNS